MGRRSGAGATTREAGGPVRRQLLERLPLDERRRWLPGITVPTAMVWGRHDRRVHVTTAEAASARHGWPLHVIEDAADDPAVEQPGELPATLRQVVAAFHATTHGGTRS